MFRLTSKTRTLLTIVVGLLILLSTAYLVLLLIAPQRLQQLGSGLRTGTGRSFSIASAGESGYYHLLANLLAEEIKGETVRVRPSQGTQENLELLANGEVNFALVQGALDPEKTKGLTAVAAISWQYVHLIVPKDSSVSALHDLGGKTVSVGPARSGNATLGKRIFQFFRPRNDTTLIATDLKNIEADFAQGTMDAIFLVYDFHAPLAERLLATGAYRLVPIAEAEAAAYPLPGCFPAIIPKGTYGPERELPQQANFPSLKVKTLLVTHAHTNRYMVQQVLQVIYSARYIKRARLANLNEGFGRNVVELPLHPAAARFYQRHDPISSDRFEIGSSLMAALLFLASVSGFLARRSKKRNLNRLRKAIVPYFEELLGYSERLAASEDVDELRTLLNQMMHTQRTAEKEWLSDRLDTEDMENLYVIYGIRCNNIFNKINKIQQQQTQRLLQQLIPGSADSLANPQPD